jgi:LuxR family maltose regulon positive regulatory protein
MSESEKEFLHDWISSQDIHNTPEVNSTPEELSYLLWARWLIYSEKYEDALQLLDHLLNQADNGGRQERTIIIRIIQAIAHEASGASHKALQILSLAIELAEPEGFCRIFVDEGLEVLRLLRELLTGTLLDDEGNTIQIPHNYVKKLILSYESLKEQTTGIELPDPLSKREQDVLLMLSAGLSNNDIAKKLYISKDTVKSHLKNINIKLNTGNRQQAVVRAQELGLL